MIQETMFSAVDKQSTKQLPKSSSTLYGKKWTDASCLLVPSGNILSHPWDCWAILWGHQDPLCNALTQHPQAKMIHLLPDVQQPSKGRQSSCSGIAAISITAFITSDQFWKSAINILAMISMIDRDVWRSLSSPGTGKLWGLTPNSTKSHAIKKVGRYQLSNLGPTSFSCNARIVPLKDGSSGWKVVSGWPVWVFYHLRFLVAVWRK